MDENQALSLKKKLMQYPGTTEEEAIKLIRVYAVREDEKEKLLERKLSNAMVEYMLDRKGYPRPPGWHSVFFYPDSWRPRNKYVCLFAIVLAITIWFY